MPVRDISHDVAERLRRDRLREEIDGTQLHRRDRIRDTAMGGQDDDRYRMSIGADPAKGLQLRVARDLPQVFGAIYLIGGIILATAMLLTWLLTYLVVIRTNDESKIWTAFERYERTGTRVMIIVFQLFILLEVFY